MYNAASHITTKTKYCVQETSILKLATNLATNQAKYCKRQFSSNVFLQTA